MGKNKKNKKPVTQADEINEKVEDKIEEMVNQKKNDEIKEE